MPREKLRSAEAHEWGRSLPGTPVTLRRRAGIGAALLLALLGACTLPPRQPAAPRRNLDHFLEARLGLDAAGHAYAASIERDAAGERVTVQASRDYGLSWPLRNGFSTGPYRSRRDLDLCTGAPGEIYLAWIEEQGGPADVRFTRSLDGGTTWLPEDRRLAGDPSASARAESPRVRCDDRGNVYVVWLDDREGFAALYANRSRDHGETWMPADRRITTLDIGSKSAPEVDCDDEGNLYVTWAEDRSGQRRILANVSTDYGETWEVFEQAISAGTRSRRPWVVALDGGTAVVVWLDDSRSGGRIFMSRTIDRGATWEAPHALGATILGTASPPRVLKGSRTEVYVVWQVATAGTATRIVLAASRDSGVRFAELASERPTGLAALPPDLEALASEAPIGAAADRSGNVYVSWSETAVGSVRLGFDRVADYGRSWVHPQHGLDLEARLDVAFPSTTLPALVPELAADDFGHVCLLWNLGYALSVAASPFNGDSGWSAQSF